jgi:ATP-dependent Clp protease ATP-binding subunit ClpA
MEGKMVKIEKNLYDSIQSSYDLVKEMKHEYMTPEHLLYSIAHNNYGKSLLLACEVDMQMLNEELNKYFSKLEKIYDEAAPMESVGYVKIFESCISHAVISQQDIVQIGDVLISMFEYEDSHASNILKNSKFNKLELLQLISHGDLGLEGSVVNGENNVQEKKSILEKFTIELTSLANEGVSNDSFE